VDVQLETGLRLLLKTLKEKPVVKPDFSKRPDFSPKIGF